MKTFVLAFVTTLFVSLTGPRAVAETNNVATLAGCVDNADAIDWEIKVNYNVVTRRLFARVASAKRPGDGPHEFELKLAKEAGVFARVFEGDKFRLLAGNSEEKSYVSLKFQDGRSIGSEGTPEEIYCYFF